MRMARSAARWTLAELHRMPDDGNKYELVRGELFVTPPPSVEHESLATVLHRHLDAYVQREGLGRVWTPRGVVRRKGSEVEPDLCVRQVPDPLPRTWAAMPVPSLVVEVLSDTTRRRDQVQKRTFYMLDADVPEYWIVDGEERVIRVVRRGVDDHEVADQIAWHPAGAARPFVLDVRAYFRDALG